MVRGNISGKEMVDTELLASAALLHDIGTYVLFDDNGKVGNERLYPLHAILSAKIIADEGIDSRVASLVETHILLGLSKQEIIEKPWPLPARDYIPLVLKGSCCATQTVSTQRNLRSMRMMLFSHG